MKISILALASIKLEVSKFNVISLEVLIKHCIISKHEKAQNAVIMFNYVN